MTSAESPDRDSTDMPGAIELPPLPDHDTWASDIDGTSHPVWSAESMQAYARAAVLADRDKRARLHIQGDGPFTRADVEALCEIAVAAYKRALEIQSGTKLP
jgi:hypothetical protein